MNEQLKENNKSRYLRAQKKYFRTFYTKVFIFNYVGW